MACGIGVVACDSGGPRESVVDIPDSVMERVVEGGGIDEIEKEGGEGGTGWLRPPEAEAWAKVLGQIYTLHLLSQTLSPSPYSQTSSSSSSKPSVAEAAAQQFFSALSQTSQSRALNLFSMSSMSTSLASHLEHAVEMGPVDVWRSDELGALSTILGWILVGVVMGLGIAVGRVV